MPYLKQDSSSADVYFLHAIDIIGICIGNGDGVFKRPGMISTGRNPSTIFPGDFDNDGRTDLLVLNLGEAPQKGSVSVLLNRFQP